MATLNISLSEALKNFAQTQGETTYSNPSDYVRSLIREDKERKEARQRVDALLLEGLNSGDPIPVNASYWKELKAELHEEINNNK